MSSLEELKYEIELDEKNKVIKAVVFGYFQPEDLQFFANKYNSVIEKIITREYELHFYSKDLRINFFDLDGLLTASFEMFYQQNFKQVFLYCGTNDQIKQRVEKIAENTKLNNFKIV